MEQRGIDKSFSNGNEGPADCGVSAAIVDWYAGSEDTRLLSHWAVM